MPGDNEAAADQAIDDADLVFGQAEGFGGRRGPDLTYIADKLTRDNLIIRIVNGGTNMPAFGPSLKPGELDDLVAFLQSRKRSIVTSRSGRSSTTSRAAARAITTFSLRRSAGSTLSSRTSIAETSWRRQRARASRTSSTPAQRRAVIEEAARASRLPAVLAIQIDFDAVASERAFYRALLGELRGRLPEAIGLSITALASWCLGDPWIDGLPVDEAVPMLFQMGRDSGAVRSRLRSGGPFGPPLCRESLGISTDEPAPVVPGVRRIYVFHRVPWTEAAVGGVTRLARQ